VLERDNSSEFTDFNRRLSKILSKTSAKTISSLKIDCDLIQNCIISSLKTKLKDTVTVREDV
jgi:hypothetical protein